MKIVIHHYGKAGELFSALPMAGLLKQYNPAAIIQWVTLDIYVGIVEKHPLIDKIVTVSSQDCTSMLDIGELIAKTRFDYFKKRPAVNCNGELHIDAYYDYLLANQMDGSIGLAREPFYLQFYKNAAKLCGESNYSTSWSPPEWVASDKAKLEAEAFEKRYGGGPVLFLSPYVADKTCVHDNASAIDLPHVVEKLKSIGLPVLYARTRFDSTVTIDGLVDAGALELSLEGLFYILKNRAKLAITSNSGIGFSAHWLGVPCIMIDNRTGWKAQVQEWKKVVSKFSGVAFDNENQWPPFLLDNFSKNHLLNVPFRQIVWHRKLFDQCLSEFISHIA